MGCIVDSHQGQREAEMCVCGCVRKRGTEIENILVYYQESLSERAGALQEKEGSGRGNISNGGDGTV